MRFVLSLSADIVYFWHQIHFSFSKVADALYSIPCAAAYIHSFSARLRLQSADSKNLSVHLICHIRFYILHKHHVYFPAAVLCPPARSMR